MIKTPRPTNYPAFQRFRSNFISLLWEASGFFLIFVGMLILTGGKPPGWMIPVTFSFGSGFVVLTETRRELQFRRRSQIITSEAEQTPVEVKLPQNDQDSPVERKGDTADKSTPIHYLQNGEIEAWNEWRRKQWGSFVDLRGAILNNANLRGAVLSGANLRGAVLSKANLSNANLSNANLRGANLSGAVLSGAVLIEANLSGAILIEANLSGAILYRANLYRANLYRAKLNGAILYRAKLNEADLSEADLNGAIRSKADLSKANTSWLRIRQC